jgi:carbonic anhydrase/acetyltransferase-like protein (isoleucine patch superfamily)
MLRKIKTYIRRIQGKDEYYSKGMNSEVDSLSDLVVIGENFISAPGSIILAHDASTITHSGKTRVEKTIVGNNVFLGANAVVLPGSTIGDNCIIGAGSVVSKIIPPNMVVAGNPGKVIMSVDEYIKKCDDRNVLYDLPDFVLKKHGKGIRYTREEMIQMNESIYQQYQTRNKNQ